MQEKIKSLYGMPILREPIRDFRKPLTPEDILITPITTYAGLSRIDDSRYSFAFVWGMLLAWGIIIFFLS